MRLPAPSAASLLALALSLALAACGEDGDSTTVTEPGVSETPGAAPEGPLTAQGVGPVERGAGAGEVEAAFGEPDRDVKGPGCELSGPNAPKVQRWSYDLGDGELTLSFKSASGELGEYRNTSPSLETTLGDRVGDGFASVRDNWGSDLKRFPLGQVTPQNGIWAVSDGPEDKLMFEIQDGRVTAILGGFVQVCE